MFLGLETQPPSNSLVTEFVTRVVRNVFLKWSTPQSFCANRQNTIFGVLQVFTPYLNQHLSLFRCLKSFWWCWNVTCFLIIKLWSLLICLRIWFLRVFEYFLIDICLLKLRFLSENCQIVKIHPVFLHPACEYHAFGTYFLLSTFFFISLFFPP